jgi:hypothetical protein
MWDSRHSDAAATASHEGVRSEPSCWTNSRPLCKQREVSQVRALIVDGFGGTALIPRRCMTGRIGLESVMADPSHEVLNYLVNELNTGRICISVAQNYQLAEAAPALSDFRKGQTAELAVVVS